MTVKELIRPLPGARHISLLRQRMAYGTQRISGRRTTR